MATYSVDFDGSNDYVSLGQITEFDNVPNDGTPRAVSLWVKTTENRYGRWVFGYTDILNSLYCWGLQLLFGQMAVWVGGAVTYGPTINDGDWHHILISVRNISGTITMEFWVDGVSEGTNSVYSINAGGIDWMVGATSSDNASTASDHCAERVCEVSLWNNVSFNGTAATELYNSGNLMDLSTHSLAAGLIGWWKFGEGDTYPTLLDSASAYDATMTNMDSGDIVTDAPPSSGGTNYTASPSETVSLSEALSVSRGTSAGPSETVSVSDSLAAGTAYTASPSETVSVSDSLGFGFSANVSPAETVSLSDSLGSLYAAVLALAESLSLSESVSIGSSANYTGNVSETVSLSEALGSIAALGLGVSETVSVSESLSVLRTAIAGLAETVSLAEAVAAQRAATVGVSETVTLVEQIGAMQAAIVALTETLTLAENVAGTRPDLIASLLVVVNAVAFAVRSAISEHNVTSSVAAYSVRTILEGESDMIHVNTRVRITGSFTNPSGAGFDPTTLSLVVTHSDGSTATYTYPANIVRDSAGVFHYDLLCTVAGNTRFQWRSTATGEEIYEEGRIRVSPVSF